MYHAMRCCAVGLLVSGLLSGCGDAPRGGVAADVDLAAIESLPVERVASIGSLNDSLQGLTRPGDIVIGEDGSLFISQPDRRHVRVYDPRGAFVRRIGRQGEGPGEFGSLAFVDMVHDTLNVTDNALQRINSFSQAGDFLGSRQWATTMRMERSEGGVGIFYEATVPQIRLAADTGIVEVLVATYAVYDPTRKVRDPVLRFENRGSPFVRVNASGEALDTLLETTERSASFGVPLDGDMRYYRAPFSDEPRYTLMRDGSGVAIVNGRVAATRRGAFDVTVIGPYRDTVFSRTITYDALPVSDGAIGRAASALAARSPSGADAGAIESSLRASGLLPAALPPVTAVTSGQDGSLWLRVEIDSAEESEWIALYGGEVGGAVRLPAGDSIVAARDGLIATVFQDELDVPYVRIYRVQQP